MRSGTQNYRPNSNSDLILMIILKGGPMGIVATDLYFFEGRFRQINACDIRQSEEV